MSKRSRKYGAYYGELIEANDNIIYCDWDEESTQGLIKDLKECGVTEILFDVEDDNDYSDTVFFETTENTDFKKLLLTIINCRPDEFSEETPHHFRMWFD